MFAKNQTEQGPKQKAITDCTSEQGDLPRVDASRFPAARSDFDPTPRFPTPIRPHPSRCLRWSTGKKIPIFLFPVAVRGAAAAPVQRVSDSAVAGLRGVGPVGFPFGSAEAAGLLLQFGQQ